MAEPEKKRWVLVKMLHGAVERTEAQIEELKAGGLWVRDASGPQDSHGAPAGGRPEAPSVTATPAAVTGPAPKLPDRPAQ